MDVGNSQERVSPPRATAVTINGPTRQQVNVAGEIGPVPVELTIRPARPSRWICESRPHPPFNNVQIDIGLTGPEDGLAIGVVASRG